MSIWLIGSTGMLGQAFTQEAAASGKTLVGVARTSLTYPIDFLANDWRQKLSALPKPKLIINAAAITDLNICQNQKQMADRVHVELPEVLAEIANTSQARLVQVSTDHYYSGDGNIKHKETDPVLFKNYYAESKFKGEQAALRAQNCLVIRTNIVGFRGQSHAPTFVEWVIRTLKNREEFAAFDDFYTSSLHVKQFVNAFWKLNDAKGILNLASREVASKKDFISCLAQKFSFALDKMTVKSLVSLNGPLRAESLGLDVSKAEQILGERLPNLQQVIDSLHAEYMNNGKI